MSARERERGHHHSRATSREQRVAGGRSFWVTLAIAAITYLLITLVITFPLALNIGGSIFAEPGDPYGALYSLWLSVREPIRAAFPHAPILVWTGAGLTQLVGEVAAYNTMVISGFVLSSLVMFCLVHKVTQRNSAAFIAGLIFLVTPFHTAQALQHVGLANLHWFLLFLLALLWFDEAPTIPRGFALGVAFAVATLDSYLYGVSAVLVLGLFGLWRVLTWATSLPRRPAWGRGQWAALLLSAALAFSLVVPAFGPIIDSIANAHTRTVALARASSSAAELKAFSARGFAYLTPPPNNVLLGDLNRTKYDEAFAQGTNMTELSIYLGLSVVALAAIGVVASRVSRRLNPNVKRWASFWILLTLVGIYWSFAPTITLFGLEVSTPGAALFEKLPLLRVYSRFALLVLIPVTVLASIGVAWLAARIHDLRRRWILAGVLGVVIVCDLLALPKNRIIAVDLEAAPAVYQWLASQDATGVGRIAEYPLLPPEEPDGYDYQLWARLHPHRSLSLDYVQSGDTEERAQLADLNREDTLSRLRAKGVTHVLVHTGKYSVEKAKKYPLEYHGGAPVYLSPREPGVSIVGTFGETNVYKIQ